MASEKHKTTSFAAVTNMAQARNELVTEKFEECYSFHCTRVIPATRTLVTTSLKTSKVIWNHWGP